MKKKNLLPMNLQFFADDEGSHDDSGNGGEDNGSGTENEDSKSGANDEDDEKTFTQSQVSAMMAKEKKEGKKSILKSLGFSSEEEAKNAITLLNTLKDSQKSDKDKLEDTKNKSASEIESVTARAELAESKLTCLENGVDKDCLDDVMAIASLKVDDDNSLEDVIKSMKKDQKYSSFFTSQNRGTGRAPGNNHGDDNDDTGNYGKTLASKSSVKSSSNEKKTSYFD